MYTDLRAKKMLWYVVQILVLAFLIVYGYFKYIYTYWRRRGIPYIESNVPLGVFSDIILARKNMGELYLDLYNRSTEIAIGVYQIHNPTLIIRNPELIKHILVKDFPYFYSHGSPVNEDFDPLSAHLFALSGKRWKTLRAKLTPTFSSGKIKMMLPTLLTCGKELCTHLQQFSVNNQPAEMKEILARFTTDVIASCAFGITCNSLKDPEAEFRKWGKKAFDPNFETILRGVASFMLPTISKIFKIASIPPDVTKFFQNVVRETIKFREENHIVRYDFMQLLIQLKNYGSVSDDESWSAQKETANKTKDEGLSETEIMAQSFVFFLAGFETSSTTLTFCLYELAVNTNIQTKLRDEIISVLQEYGENITYEAIQKMVYLDKVVSETLRKYPPLPFLNRKCTKSYKVPETEWELEEGTSIIIPLLAIHKDPRYYPDPDKFDPERFDEEAKNKRNAFTYMPFGEGPRICIGMRFGTLQTKVGVISIIREYTVGVCRKTPVPMVLDRKSFFLSPDGNRLWLEIRNI